MKSAILVCLLVFALGINLAAGRYGDNSDYFKEFRRGRSGRGTCNVRSIKDRFIRGFLRQYCEDAEGNYELCRECVAVACLQYLARPHQIRRYEDCVFDHNRCCTKPGASANNVAGGAKCYATGWISEVGWGQVSVIRTLLGGQSADAPGSIHGRMRGRDD